MSGGSAPQARNILVFRIGQLGDTLVSLPAISAILRRHPSHRLVLLTEKQETASGHVSSWDVLGPTGWFGKVITYTPGKNLFMKAATMASLASRIRALNPERVYDLAPERNARQARRDRFFFTRMAGIRDYHGGGYLDKPPKNAQGALPRLMPEWRRLLRTIDAEEEGGNFHLEIPPGDISQAREVMKRAGIGSHVRMLAVGAGSKMPAKRWPKERFSELGRRLLDADPGLHLLVIGGKDEEPLGAALCAEWGPRAHNFAGQLSVYGSAAVLRGCEAYVGNDAGAMHLAGMVGIPCVALFSARDYPGQWEPYGGNHVILRHETDCAGCMLSECPYDNLCLGMISIDEVEQAVRRVLSLH